LIILDDPGNCERKHSIPLCAELTLEEAMGLECGMNEGKNE